MKKRIFIIVILHLFLFVNASFSQDKDTLPRLLNMSLEELMNVELSGASRYKQTSDKVTNTVIVITKKQIEERGYEDLSDLLKDIPGLNMVNNAGRFGEYYTFRGIPGNDRFLILIDGHKINSASGTFISVGNSVSVRFAKQVEIVFSPTGASYGADAIAAIINIISDDFGSKKQVINASANYGSFNRIDGFLEGHYKVKPGLSFTFSARYFQSDGPDLTKRDTAFNIISRYTPPFNTTFQQPIRDHNIYFNTQYKNLTLAFYRQAFNEGNALGLDPQTYIYNKESIWKMATNSAWATYKHYMGKTGNLVFDVNYINHAQDPDTRFLKWTNPGKPGGEAFSQYLTGKDNTVRTALTYYNTSFKKLQFVAGLEHEYTQSIPPYANDEVLGNSYKYEGDSAKKIDDALTITQQRMAGFGQLTYSPTKAIDIIIGGRYDYFTRYSGTFNPRTGAIIKPFSGTTIKLMYGTAFQPPSLFYEFEQFGTPNITMLSAHELANMPAYSGWKLKNQRVESYEASLTQKIGRKIQVKLAAYHNNLYDLIERVTFADKTKGDSMYNKYFDNYTSAQRNENIGKVKVYGADLMLTAIISTKIKGYVNYSYTDAYSLINDNKNPLPRVASQRCWAGFTVSDLFGYVTVSPRVKWVGKINNSNKNVFPDGYQDGFTCLDMSLSVNNLVKHCRFYTYFDNILNSNIYYGGLFDQRAPYTPTIPEAGFTFRLGAQVGF